MGSRSSRAKHAEWDLDRLAETSGLSRNEIDRLLIDFKQAAGRDGVLQMQEFIPLYSRLPGVQVYGTERLEEQARRIFRTFDRDHTNTLSFDEFLNVIVLVNHTLPRHDRIGYLIRQNSNEKRQHMNGMISSQYGHQILRRICDYYGSSSGQEHLYWKQIDPENRGYVTHEEFVNFISRHPDFNRK
ncbi:unnamed protein product [Adineta ricciae]|uniref:EF-hand domain-containing protein n=1 Tax=Adineta ricciae TaxID=249248 RepID=A0A816DLI3_ADIRI|nr:unnamed protein product [Adineta ricciae]